MRLDKFLKVSRIIKRRTIANQACSAGRVTVNNRVAKAATEVQIGDILEIRFGNRKDKFEVLQIMDHVAKNTAGDMYKIISQDTLKD